MTLTPQEAEQILETLKGANELLKGGRIVGANAKDKKGNICGSISPDAVKWSVPGAIISVAYKKEFSSTVEEQALYALGQFIEGGGSGGPPYYRICSWNDDSSVKKKDVTDTFQRVISALQNRLNNYYADSNDSLGGD